MSGTNDAYNEVFIKPVGKTGKYSILLACVCLFLPGTYLAVVHGLVPPAPALFKALLGVWSFAIVFSIVEPIIYFTMIGFGGTYMSFLTGNLVNLRLPISVTVQQVADTREGSREAEVVSTLGVAASLLASQAVLTVGVLLFLPFIDRLNASGSPTGVALKFVLPALLGAVGGMFVFRNAKLGIIPVTLGFIAAFLFPKIPSSYAIFPLVVISIASARFLYKKGWV